MADRNNPLAARARELRRFPTEEESWLWRDLRKLEDSRFRRQVVIGRFIVDFACHRTRVAVELDGDQHGEAGHRERDQTRDAWLESQGYRVLRFANREVWMESDAVLDAIWEATRR